MASNGEDIHRLTMTGRCSHPEYSPDGSRIVFERSPSVGLPQIWVINADGAEPCQLTIHGGGSPSWSPDGTQIVYVRKDWTRDDPSLGVLWLVDVKTKHETQLTHQWPEQCAKWPDCETTATKDKSWSAIKGTYGTGRPRP
jgi:Tol biopolymer transport system component